MYCKVCGMEIDPRKSLCPNCGKPIAEVLSQKGASNRPVSQQSETEKSPLSTASSPREDLIACDAPSPGYMALCFFIPPVGLILFLVWNNQFPLKAKSCGKGALVNVIVSFVLGLLSYYVYTSLLSMH